MFPLRADIQAGKEGDPDGKDLNRRMLGNGVRRRVRVSASG